jgi:hypothetical protein
VCVCEREREREREKERERIVDSPTMSRDTVTSSQVASALQKKRKKQNTSVESHPHEQ